ncbi:MAG: SPW repeat protein [Pseudonocardiales bacterium]|nr:SPW repeat protein [Pseudonocardiales bacterium]
MDEPGQDRRAAGADPGQVPYMYPAGGAGASPDPARPMDPAAAGLLADAHDEGLAAATFSALAFLAGVWLVLAPFVLTYPDLGGGFDARWNDRVVGAAIAVVATVRMLSPNRTAAFGWVNVGLGAWLVAAPFVLFYNDDRVAAAATVNDLAIGVLVIALAGASRALSRRGRRRSEPRT